MGLSLPYRFPAAVFPVAVIRCYVFGTHLFVPRVLRGVCVYVRWT
jgi:hypothetical protein